MEVKIDKQKLGDTKDGESQDSQQELDRKGKKEKGEKWGRFDEQEGTLRLVHTSIRY